MGPVTSLRHLTGQRKRPCARSPFWNRSQRQPPARAGDTFQTTVVAIFARLIKRRCGSPRQQEIRAALARRGGVKVFSDRLCETAFPPSTGWRGSTRAIAAFTPPRADRSSRRSDESACDLQRMGLRGTLPTGHVSGPPEFGLVQTVIPCYICRLQRGLHHGKRIDPGP